MKPVRNLLIIFAGAVILAACSTPVDEPVDPATIKVTAWEYYAAGDYQAAEAAFRTALKSLSYDGEALVGQGWSLLYIRSLAGAGVALAKVSSADSSWYVDARAGLAAVYDATGETAKSLSAARMALTLDSAWVFLHDPQTAGASTDWRDLEYLRAKGNLILSAQTDPTFENALAALARIDDGSPLDAADPGSWTADGVQYGTLAEALLKRLESIAR